MEQHLRLLLFLRLFMRSFAFAYPLFLTVMYNFWIFGKLPGFAWVGYVVVMAVWELLMGIAGDRLPLKSLLVAYFVLALPLELPTVLFDGAYFDTVLVFLPWVIFWYGSLLILSLFLIKQQPENNLIH
ncbi:hypothetical protein [Thermococcus sp. 21S7]|uniref:hypothetical protein n=1 Tax=Thermococcus sp. 21S7 TaxID=1638221 RepID=UPI001439CB65|nr:hypothetical protein [Thermococcus sp. 21S7]NJE61858.1 hypothetical protein [Thermococcus sp. 21S7]